MGKPDSNIIYGLNDVPPVKDLLLLSIQQMLLLFTAATFPAMLVKEVGGTIEEAGSMVALTMIAAGIGSVIQASRNKWMGSGYLCPNVCGPSYIAVSMQAAWSGGFPVMRGMIVFAGVVEMLLSGVIKKLTFLFPPVVVGLVVMMVGVSVIPVSVSNFFGIKYAGDSIAWQDVTVGLVALAVMVSANIWGKRAVKMFCLLLGVLAGWILALVIIPDALSDMNRIIHEPWIAFPVHDLNQLSLGFSSKLIVPFLVISLCGSLKSFGNLVAAQKISEPDLKELDMKPIGKGLLADGFTTSMAGLMGGMAVDTSSSNVGLAAATGAVSRWIAICAGTIFAILGFSPKLSTAIAMVPGPVVGACLLFAVSFMIVTGLQEMTTEKLNERKVFAMGIAFILGVGTGLVPEVFARMPHFLRPFFSDPLSSTTVLAVVLYQIFHIDHLWRRFKKDRPE
ncbi:MAG: purine/pyrimidine permease [Desulfatibacillum sp.]|nr:purine/pyrimidine permease [Desulfatibacillum sp.]